MISVSLTTLFVLLTTYNKDKVTRKIFKQKKMMELAQKKIELESNREIRILKNIFPVDLISHLRNKQYNNALRQSVTKEMMNLIFSPQRYSDPYIRRYEFAASIMVDIVHFTEFSSKNTSKFIIECLNRYYSIFDTIVDMFNLEKIKSIGDAYYCVALEEPKEGAKRSVLAAMKMLREFRIISRKQKTGLELRLGVGCGDAFIVIFGVDLLTFDCFGKAVSDSIRMEKTSKPNCIKVSNEVKQLTSDLFEYTEYKSDFNDEENGFYVSKMKSSKSSPLVKKKNKKEEYDEVVNSYVISDEKKKLKSSSGVSNVMFEERKDNKKGISNKKGESSLDESSRWKINLLTLSFRRWSDNMEYNKHSYNVEKVYLKLCMFIVWIGQISSLGTLVFLTLDRFSLYHIILLSVSFVLFLGCILYAIIPLTFTLAVIISIIVVIINTLFLQALILIELTFSSHNIDELANLLGYYLIFFTLNQVIFPNIYFYIKLLMTFLIPITLIPYFFFPEISEIITFNLFINYLLIFFCSMVGFYDYHYKSLVFFKERKLCEEKNEKLEIESKLNEKLLQSTLPMPVIEKMMKNITLKYDTVDKGCILFCKISNCNVNYNNHVTILRFLNDLFCNFDRIVLQDGKCWKIKSHFSNYLVVNGINSSELEDVKSKEIKETILFTAKKIISCGMEIIRKHDLIETHFITIGINFGNWSVGIIGRTKFLFDCIGDTINVSCRLAESSEKNQIQVSESFRTGLNGKFTERKNVFLKGKGNITTYYVHNEDD